MTKQETAHLVRTMTPTQLERSLTRAFSTWEHRDPTREELTTARATFSAIRARHGFTTPAALLSEDVQKMEKNRRRTLSLALLPHKHSGLVNLCAYEDKCSDPCVAFSGNGGFTTTQTARLARVELLTEHPQHFAALLIHELATAYRTGSALAVRLNAYSDIRWERIAPWIFARFPRIAFYDYTKHPLRSRPVESLPTNYRLTYSASPRTTRDDVETALQNGRNVAVVFPQRANTRDHHLPRTLVGHRVIDGDRTDERYRDPVAVIVGLRRKGSLKATDALAQIAARLENDTQ